MPRLSIVFAALILSAAGCALQPSRPTEPIQTASPPPRITLLPSLTSLPPTPTVPLTGDSTPTPLPTDTNSLKPILRSTAEKANLGSHTYSYSCYAWSPCTCVAVRPRQIDITFKFAARSVDLLAGDYTQTYLWKTANAYIASLGTLSTQLTFFENGFELYSVIDNRSCTQERYSFLPAPTATP